MSHLQVIKKKCGFVAKISTKKVKCLFCRRDTNDEITYGKLYDIGDVSCHYFCALLSCYLIQKGKDDEGLFGFLYKDIIAEAERGRKYKCSFCSLGGATLGCSMPQCRKQFHLPCGRERNAVSLFHQNFRSFCEKHAPKQKIPADIMAKANERRRNERRKKKKKSNCNTNEQNDTEEVFCVICYEAVPGYPCVDTFWPSCCGKDAWFHRSCLQRMALSSGMHYLKCPLCNDKDDFYTAVLNQGYFVPDRDAAWELEQNAFSEIYERPTSCSAVECKCYMGRDHDAETGAWDLKLCLLCGSCCVHAGCMPEGATQHYVCALCNTVTPPDLDALHELAVRVAESQARQESSPRRGPIVGSRMSLRSTKQLPPKKSRTANQLSIIPINEPATPQPSGSEYESTNTTRSRLVLNLPTPKRNAAPTATDDVPLTDLTNVFSPMKMVEASLRDRIMAMDVKEMSVVDTKNLIEKVREKFKTPRPLSQKRRIVSDILEDILNKSNYNFKGKSEIISGEVSSQTNEIHYDVENKVSNEIITEDNVNVITNNDLSTSNDASTVPKMSNDLTDDNCDLNIHDDSSVTLEPHKKEEEEQSVTSQVNDVNADDTSKSDDLSTRNDASTVPKMSNEFTDDNCDLNIHDDSVTLEPHNKEEEEQSVTSQVNEANVDDTSKSTFELPSEFIADIRSDDSENYFETPKKRKSVNLEIDSSLEISEENKSVSVDVVKMETKVKLKDKCSYKFSPIDKETLQDKNLNIDLELFKNRYLTEVDRDTYKCAFDHKHDETQGNSMVCTNNYERREKKLKRKSSLKHIDKTKKKKSDRVINLIDEDEHCDDARKSVDEKSLQKSDEKHVVSPIKLIFREESNSLSPDDKKVYKQTVLSFVSKNNILSSPELSSPSRSLKKKEKRPRNTKSQDSLRQTSIVKFFSANNC